MFGIVEAKGEEEQEKVFFASAAHDYIRSNGGWTTNSKISSAIKSGGLKANKTASGHYEIRESDLIRWAVENANMPEKENQTGKLMQKYSMRYHIDNVLLELQTNWGLKLYSDHSRGFYLSFTKSLEELAVISIEEKSKSKTKLLTLERAKAKETALKKLGLKE